MADGPVAQSLTYLPSSIELVSLSYHSRQSRHSQDADAASHVQEEDIRRSQVLNSLIRPYALDSRALKRPISLLTQLWNVLMSQTPLFTQSAAARDSESYGAIPYPHYSRMDSATPTSIDDTHNGKRRRSVPEGEYIQHLDEGVRRRRSSSDNHRRKTLSGACDVSLGLDAKTSFAGPGEIAGQEQFSSESSNNEDHSEDDEHYHGNTTEDDNSPYPEVRASVPNTDNISLSINTPRMWALSLLFAVMGSATNLFFSLRYPSVTITPVIALVLVHPLGRLWDLALKRRTDPESLYIEGARQGNVESESLSLATKIRRWLAQGKWNEKEHACVYISSNVSFGFAFATDVIVEQNKFYKQETPILYQLLLTISTQILGYAFAGLTRRYLVRPAAMIWPGTLMSTAMFTTMHRNENKPANGWSISRYRFFCFVWAGAFLWYFVPGLLMPALSYFNVITWFAPKNVVVANLFGVVSGLGMFPLTFDWAQIAYIGSPLLTPWWAAANVVGGLALIMWIIAPILYYTNKFFSAHLPLVSSAVFDDRGKPYNVTKILTDDFIFDNDAYENYSHVYLPITYVLSYAVQFAALTALVSHTTCWYGKDILNQSKEAYNEKSGRNGYQSLPQSVGGENREYDPLSDPLRPGEDVHCKLMRRYVDVPMWWYLLTLVAMLAIGVFVVEYYPTHLPWYGLLLAVGITTILFIPVAIVMAITNQHSSLYLICQLICGVVFPGRPVANMVFVTYCYISSAQGVKFSSDLKLGHYMKIPPKILFQIQMAATLVSSFVQIGVLNWMFSHVPGICTPEAINGFICPLAKVHFNGSILWGVVGPHRFFGPGALYRSFVWAFLIGLITPILIWLISRKKKRSMWRKVNLPVLFGSLSWIPPATGLNFSIWAAVCFSFNYVIRRRAPAWWGKYTMNMSAALDSGLAFALVAVFFGFVYPGWMGDFKWWGTEIYKQGCDWQACPYMPLAPGERFGAGAGRGSQGFSMK